MLYIVSTPIGNLQDITLRALETLKTVDCILAEDTRRTKILLNHFAIDKPVYSFHEHNEKRKEDEVIQHLKDGKNIALVSDAGTPLISDPGEMLIKRVIQEQIPFTAIPGVCAVITALSLSGMNAIPFQFLGFLPKKEGGRKKFFEKALAFEGTTIFYESAYRIDKAMRALSELNPDANVVIARELTKKFEELLRGSALSLATLLKERSLKGELVILMRL